MLLKNAAQQAAQNWQQFKASQEIFNSCSPFDTEDKKSKAVVYYGKCQAILTSTQSLDKDVTFNVTANYTATIRRYVEMMQAELLRMEQQLKTASRSTENTGDGTGRTDGMSSDQAVFDPSQINTWGDLYNFVKNHANTETTQGQSFLDLLVGMTGDKQKYSWQQASDDLAYQRTNFDTLVAQYQAAGMSRAAAIAAASGSSASVTGSSVSSTLGSTFAPTGLAQQQLGLQAQQIGVQQEANQQAYALGMSAQTLQAQSIEQQQQALDMKQRELDAALYTQEQMIAASKAMQETYGFVYGMHKFHFNVPLYATISQKTFKDWLRDKSDEMANYQALVDAELGCFHDDGTFWFVNADGEWEQDLMVTEEYMDGLSFAAAAYGSIQKNTDNQFYGKLFEDYFMSNAGPRAYHEQEDASELIRAQIALDQEKTALDSLVTQCTSQEFYQSLNTDICSCIQWGNLLDPDAQNRLNQIINENGWAVDLEQGCVYYQGTTTKVSAEQLLQSCAPQTAAYMTEARMRLAAIQSLATETNMQAFTANYHSYITESEARCKKANIAFGGLNMAEKWMSNNPVLQGASAVKIVCDSTILGDIAHGVAQVGLSYATGGISARFAGKASAAGHAYRMREIEAGKKRTIENFDKNGSYIGGQAIF